MDSAKLFEAALSVTDPWFIKAIEFDSGKQRLDIYIDFKRGSSFSSENPEYPGSYKAYDTVNKTWRHMNFFQHECYLHCRTPRIKPGDGTIELVSPPWAGKNTGFTLLFEAFILELCRHMPVHAVCKIINENDNKIWRLLDKYVESSREYEDFSQIDTVGIDETSRAKGHEYVSLFVDLKQGRTVFVAEGKDHGTIDQFAKDLTEHDGDPKNIKDVSCDMSPAFIKGVRKTLPNANITFDKFHIIKLINEAVDTVRRQEVASQPLLKKARYIFLKNENKLTVTQREKLKELSLPSLNIKSVRALRIREAYQAIYNAETEEDFILLLKKWYFWATHSRLKPIQEVAKTIKKHWDGVVEWKRSQISNGILEGLNSIVQAAKAKSRGFRTFKYFKIMVYLVTGKLNFNKVNAYC